MGLHITLTERSETRMVKDTSHRIHVSFSLKDARLQDSSLVSGKFTLLVCNTHIIICVYGYRRSRRVTRKGHLACIVGRRN